MKKWIFPTLATIAAYIVSLVTYDRLPEQMAVHFGASGTPDNWMSKPFAVFLLPAFILLIALIIVLSGKLEKDENKRRRLEAAEGTIIAIMAFIFLSVHLLIIAYNLGYEVSIAKTTTILVGVTFMLMGNFIPRLPQGSMQWPKLPEPVQRKASRFQGRIMMMFGFTLVFVSLLPSSYILPTFFVLLASFIIFLISSTIYYIHSESRNH